MRNSAFPVDPVYEQAMTKVTRCVEAFEADLKQFGTTPEGLVAREAKYRKDLVMITGPRRELILSTEASRRR